MENAGIFTQPALLGGGAAAGSSGAGPSGSGEAGSHSIGGCRVHCGVTAAKDWDHIKPATKLYGLPKTPPELHDAERAKCQPLCIPCHRKKTRAGWRRWRRRRPSAPRGRWQRRARSMDGSSDSPAAAAGARTRAARTQCRALGAAVRVLCGLCRRRRRLLHIASTDGLLGGACRRRGGRDGRDVRVGRCPWRQLRTAACLLPRACRRGRGRCWRSTGVWAGRAR